MVETVINAQGAKLWLKVRLTEFACWRTAASGAGPAALRGSAAAAAAAAAVPGSPRCASPRSGAAAAAASPAGAAGRPHVAARRSRQSVGGGRMQGI